MLICHCPPPRKSLGSEMQNLPANCAMIPVRRVKTNPQERGLAERAGYEGGKLPFTVPGFDPKEITEGLADVPRPKISRSRLRGPGFMGHAY